LKLRWRCLISNKVRSGLPRLKLRQGLRQGTRYTLLNLGTFSDEFDGTILDCSPLFRGWDRHCKSVNSAGGCTHGFTLIEVLVSIFIGAIVLSVLYASFFQIISAKDTVESELEFYHEARVILARLREDLTTAYPRGMVYSPSGGSKYDFFTGKEEGKNSSVSFISFSDRQVLNSTASDQAQIGYYLQPIPDSDLFSLVRVENPLFGSDSGGVRYPISEHIVEFNLAYMTSEGEFVKEWNSLQSGSLPRAVELTLVMRNPRGEDVLFNSLVLLPLANLGSNK